MNQFEKTIVNLFDLQWVKENVYRNRLDVYVILNPDTYLFKFPKGDMRVTARGPEILFACFVVFETCNPDFVEWYGARFNDTEHLMNLLRYVKKHTPENIAIVKPYLKGV